MTNPLAQDLGGVVLLPCPFCGAEMKVSERGAPWHPINDGTRGFCIIAGLSIHQHHINLWNTRTHSAEIAGALRDAERWQTIESAPRDGSEVWAYNGEQARMHWIEGEGYALWAWSDELLSDADPNPEQPTHWRPLPAPPTQDSAMQQGGGGGDHA